MSKLSTLTLLMAFMLFSVVNGLAQSASKHWNSKVEKNYSRSLFSRSGDQRVAVGPMLYGQMDDPNFDYMLISAEITNNSDLNAWAAEDFSVPAGETWNIGTVQVKSYSYSYDKIEGFNLILMSDDNGKPGTEIKNLSIIEGYTLTKWTLDAFEFATVTLNFDATVSLTQGRYWVSVRAIGPSDMSGWGILLENGATVKGKQWHWKNPSNNSQSGCIDWSSAEKTCDGLGMPYFGNFCFSIHEPVLSIDLKLESIVSPESNTGLTASEQVTIKIENLGKLSLSDFKVRFKVDEGNWVTETVTAKIASGEVLTYNFHATADLSKVKSYTITAEVLADGEENTTNTVCNKKVYNFGKIYQATDGLTLSVCEGTFTDPGGLNGDFDAEGGINVLIPGTKGKIISIEFPVCDLGFSHLKVYNGKNTQAELLGDFSENDLLGKTLKGYNEYGALTFVADASIWDVTGGWVGFITCEDPMLNNFAIESLISSDFNLFEKQATILKATIRNQGSTVQKKTVDFYANDLLIGSVESGELAIGQTAIVKLIYTPAVAGLTTFKASLPQDEGSADDLSRSFEKEVYAQGRLVESFESEKFPPLAWHQTNAQVFRRSSAADFDYPSDGLYCASLSPWFEDTLITPQLEIKAGDTLWFSNFSTGYNLGKLTLIYSTDKNGPWKKLTDIPLKHGFLNNAIDLSSCAGNHYIGFAGVGYFTVDAVKGPKRYFRQNDLYTYNLKGTATPALNSDENYSFTVQNIGVNPVKESDYTVELLAINGDEETVMATANGVNLELLQEASFTLSAKFTELKNYLLKARVVFANDDFMGNNLSDAQNIFVQKEGSLNVVVGTGNETSHLYPISIGETSSLGEILFKASDLKQTGEIHGFSLGYNCEYGNSDSLKVFIVETADEKLGLTVTSASEMYRVYNDIVKFEVGLNKELYLHFDKPFLYGGKNLRILLYWNYTKSAASVRFKVHTTSDVRINTITSSTFKTKIPFYIQEELDNLWTNRESLLPNVTFHIKATERDAMVSGTVRNENKEPFAGVKIAVDGFVNTTLTDNEGKYSIASMPYGEVELMATAFGYYDNPKKAMFGQVSETIVDFDMEKLPNVAVKGRVLSNDYNTPVNNATVKLTGYDNFETSTDANGKFIINNVFILQDYTLSILHQKILNYQAKVSVSLDTVDLGDVVVDEREQSAYNVIAKVAESKVLINWQSPYTSVKSRITDCDTVEIVSGNYLANDPGENLQLGNLFTNSEELTLNSIDVKVIGNSYIKGNDKINVKIYNSERMLVAESDSILLPNEPMWLNILLPKVTLTGDYYIMFHWNKIPHTTPFIGFDYRDKNVAYAVTGEEKHWQKLSEILPSYLGAVRIVANVEKKSQSTARILESYALYRGSMAISTVAEQWQLVAENIVGNTFTDENYSTLDSGFYQYRLHTKYTKDESEPVYSTSISKGTYAAISFALTTNSGASANGAKITLHNTIGNDIHNYTMNADENGKVTFEAVYKGEYNLNIGLNGFQSYEAKLNISTDKQINIELKELVMNPANLQATVNKAERNVTLTWALGKEKTLTLDNGTIEGALTIDGGNAYLGNLFENNSIGYLASVDIYGVAQQEMTTDQTNEVTLEIFDANFNSIGVSSAFKIPADDWFRVNMSNLPIDGTFYAMVHFTGGATNYLAIESSNDKGYYYDTEYGLLNMLEASGKAGVFLIRSNILVTGSRRSEPTLAKTQAKVEPFVKIETLSPQTAPSISSEVSYNVYLTDMNTPVAEGITERSYIFNNIFEQNGEYTAGVKALYSTGESDITKVKFNITWVSLSDNSSVNVNIMPNPARNFISIKGMNQGDVSVYALSGQLLENYSLNSAQQLLDVSSLKEGTYVLEVKNGEQIQKLKLVIQK